jgi:hypothetical protein
MMTELTTPACTSLTVSGSRNICLLEKNKHRKWEFLTSKCVQKNHKNRFITAPGGGVIGREDENVALFYLFSTKMCVLPFSATKC